MGSGGRAFVEPSDRFDLQGKLGSGGMGVVYRAFDRKRQIDVALKTLRRSDGRALYRFKREFRAVADLVHPNLVTLYELHTDGDDWFFTMELVTGQTFSEYVRPYHYDPDTTTLEHTISNTGDSEPDETEEGTKPTASFRPWPKGRQRIREGELDLDRLSDALAQLVDGIHALHRAGKLHRDLKPTNVLVEPDGRLVILDFGLTADKLDIEDDKTHATASAVGTPLYMSPEQAADVPLTEASDWYSVGVMLYEALTGRRPFEGRKADAIFLAKQTEDIPAPRELFPEIPPALDALCLALLDRDPRNRPGARHILAALGREPAATSLRGVVEQPFVGRQRQLAQLHAAYKTSQDASVCAFLRGLSGMGKSMLVRRFIEDIPPADNAVVLHGRCYEHEVVPHKTLDSVVDSLTRVLLSLTEERVAELSPPDVDALATLFPVVKRVPGLVPPLSSSDGDPQHTRRRAFTALRELLAGMAKDGPVVLYIDDLQWGDEDSAGFLCDLWERDDAPRVLLIASFRAEDEPSSHTLQRLRLAAETSNTAQLVDITIGAFNPTEVLELVEAVRPGYADEQHVERLLAESQGTPLFVAELVRRLGGDDDDAGAHTLSGLIADRVDALRADERALLDVCCVAGRPMSPTTLATAAQQSGEGRAFAVLRGEQLIRMRVGRTAEHQLVEPFHDKIREIVTASLTDQRRAELHRRIALAMELGDHPDAISQVDHWMQAGEYRRAANTAITAAEESERMLAFHLAAEFYRLALEHKQAGADERRDLMGRRGRALMYAGKLDDAADAFHEAAQGAPTDDMLEYRRLELEQILRRGHLERGLTCADEVLGHIGDKLPGSTTAAIASILFNRARLRLRGMRYTIRDDRDIEPRRLLELDVHWSASSALAFVSPLLGRVSQMKFMRRALKVGSAKRIAQALCLEMGYRALPGAKNRAVCERFNREAMAIADELEDDYLIGLIRSGSGVASFLCGRWQQAYDRLVDGERYLRSNAANARWEMDMAQAFHASAMVYLGRFAELVKLLPEYIREAEERGDSYATRNLRGQRANLMWLVLDQPDEAVKNLEAVSVGTHEFHLHHYYELLARAQIGLYRGDAAGAHARVEEHWRALERAQLLRVQTVRIEGWFLRGRCAVARAAELDDESERAPLLDLAARAIRRIAREPASWGMGFAHLLEAAIHAMRQNDSDRLTALDAAVDAFEAADMSAWAMIARLRRGRASANDTGEAEAAAAVAWLKDQCVVDPDAFADMCAPGA